MKNPELAKRLMELPEGRELLQEVKKIVLDLDSIAGLPELNDPTELSIEVKGRKRAVEIVAKELLYPLSDYPIEEEEPSEDESKDAGVE